MTDHDDSVHHAHDHASAALEARESPTETPDMAEWQVYAVDPRDHRFE